VVPSEPDSLGRLYAPTFWPAWIDSARARVCGVNVDPDTHEHRAGPWSDWGAWWHRGEDPVLPAACDGGQP